MGESCIPQIALLKPRSDKLGRASLIFPLTYVGENASESIRIKNTGVIPCKVIMDISKNPNSCFELETCEDTIPFLNLEETGSISSSILVRVILLLTVSSFSDFIKCQKTTMVNLNPSEIANFKLKYQPKVAISIQFDLKVHIVNNPFEVSVVSILINAWRKGEIYGE